MKRIFILLLICFSTLLAAQGQGFVLTGEVTGLTAGTKVFLRYKNNKEDSVIAKDNFFQFKGMLSEPARIYVMIKEPKLRYTSFWIENASIRLKGHIDSLRTAAVTGSRTNEEYNRYAQAKTGFETEIESLIKEIGLTKKSGDSAKVVQLKQALKAEEKKLVDFQVDFIKNNPGSHISMESLYFLKNDLGKAQVEKLYNGLDAALRRSGTGKQVGDYLSFFAAPKLGEKAPVFVQNDINGKPVNLEQFKGKYVLLDFWGSWCMPCVEEMPNLAKQYAAYKNKGFEIVAVAADLDKAAWQKSIREYKMDWVNLSELKGDQDKVILTYGVNYYPANYLINPDGIIIAKDLRGEQLQKKLQEIFKQ
jgi:peroxiredoxin